MTNTQPISPPFAKMYISPASVLSLDLKNLVSPEWLSGMWAWGDHWLEDLLDAPTFLAGTCWNLRHKIHIIHQGSPERNFSRTSDTLRDTSPISSTKPTAFTQNKGLVGWQLLHWGPCCNHPILIKGLPRLPT